MGPAVKQRLRAELLSARAAVSDAVHAAEARALCSHLPAVVGGAATVAAYVPIGSEPGSAELLDALLQLCSRVLLPVARTSAGGTPLPLRWGEYRKGELASAPFGLLEPREPWLPATELASAAVLLVPALSVDRHGVRLGRGAGFYDRSLGFRTPAAALVAVVRDDELVDALPVEPHDVPMTHALTPNTGLVALSDAP
ncbi:MAG: 5-formyltetrahydrofolate cyclo-ligase [Mycobacteriaceae bacterium]|nr:5-formyltetrahydrofolate cyclo-ligase [Mycobacteriaceae bacterium]